MAWHDHKWDGTICRDPRANTYCVGTHSLLSDRLAREKQVVREEVHAGERLDTLLPEYLPPCFWSSCAFADGPTVILEYARGDARLYVLQVRASAPAVEDVAPGAARRVQLSSSTALVIDGRWVEQDGVRRWDPGTMLRVIVQRADLVLQLQVDPRDGWWDRGLVELAESMR